MFRPIVISGPQGCGKSEVIREDILDYPALNLIGLPTKDLIDEQVKTFTQAMPSLEIASVYSQPRKGSTAQRLNEARRDFEARGIQHGVIFTTHETLMNHDLGGFDPYQVWVDEAPTSLQPGRLHIPVGSLRPWLKETFDLVGAPRYEWSVVRPKTRMANWAAVQQDAGVRGLAEFIKQAQQPDRVFVKARSWDDGDHIQWFSMWTPLSLSHCRSAVFAGSSFKTSIGFKAAGSFYQDRLGLEEVAMKVTRKVQPLITIYFFTRGHEGTTTFWEGHDGLKMLAPVCRHLVEKLPSTAFWSGNGIVETVMYGPMENKVPDRFIQPLAMGLNQHRHKTACAFIYSAKANDDDKALMDVFGLTKANIQHSREDEAINQFVMRGAIRERTYGGPYTIYLYSQGQALRLKAHLQEIGFTRIELVGLDEVGIMDAARPKVGRAEPTDEEKAAKAKERLETDKKRKQHKRDDGRKAAGLPPAKPGRPFGAKDGQPRKRRPAKAA